MEDKPLGLELQNSFGALGETDSEQEIPLASFDDFPSISCQIECQKKFVPKGGRFNTQTQKQKKEARTRPKVTPKKATTGGQELHPLIREDKDDHPELHADECVPDHWLHSSKVCWTVEPLKAVHQTACVQK